MTSNELQALTPEQLHETFTRYPGLALTLALAGPPLLKHEALHFFMKQTRRQNSGC